MMQLIVLERRRNSLKGYIMGAGSISLFLLVLSFLFGFLPAIIVLNGDQISDYEREVVQNWDTLTLLLSLTGMGCFSVLSAVMYSRFVIAEYTGSSVLLLFSYPIKRSRILSAKCILVFGFTCALMILCTLVPISLFALLSNLFHILPQTYTFQDGIYLLKNVGFMSILSGTIGLISMRVGFWKKSIPVSIVTSLILISILSNLVQISRSNSLLIMRGTTLVLLLLSLGLFINLSHNINHMEV